HRGRNSVEFLLVMTAPIDRELREHLEKLQKELFPDAPSNEQVAEFLAAVGTALAAWQGVEEALYLLFERATGPKRPGASGCSFHALHTFNVKINATDAAVRFALLSAPPAHQRKLDEEWIKLSKKAQKRSQKRNHLAHFATFTYY